MTGISFDSLLVVAVVAFTAPLAVGLAPGVRMPAVVLELVLGIALGPHALGWVELDDPVRVMSLVGLAFLLLLAGLEVVFPPVALSAARPTRALSPAASRRRRVGARAPRRARAVPA